MERIRDYPLKRRPRDARNPAGLTMLSARIVEELSEYVRATAYETRQSKQDIVAEALELHRTYRQQSLASK